MSTYVDEEWVLDYMKERGWDLSLFDPLMIDNIHGTINNMLPSFLAEDVPMVKQEYYIGNFIECVLKDEDPDKDRYTPVDIVDRGGVQEKPDDPRFGRRRSRRDSEVDDSEDE